MHSNVNDRARTSRQVIRDPSFSTLTLKCLCLTRIKLRAETKNCKIHAHNPLGHQIEYLKYSFPRIVRSNVELEALKDNQKSSAYHTSPNDIAKKTKEQDKILLTLLMEAVKADRKQQAFDIVRMLHNSVSMSAASQIAELYSSFALKERILLYKSGFEAKHRAKEKADRAGVSLRYLNEDYDEPHSVRSNAESKTSFEPRKGVSRRTAPATVTKNSTQYESPLPVADIPSYDDFDSTMDSSVINASPSRKRKMDDDLLSFDEPSVDRTSSKRTHHDEMVTEAAPPAKTGRFRPLFEMKFLLKLLFAEAASKNPFARGKPPVLNPFARPATGKVAQATKSKSFFERVDDIQAKGKTNGSKSKDVPYSRISFSTSPSMSSVPGTAKGKQQNKLGKDKTATKQATLFSLKSAPSKESLVADPKITVPETSPEENIEEDQSHPQDFQPVEEDLEETQMDETQIDETPQPITEEPEAMEDDEEPLEWEESDREEEEVVAPV
ncbi:hypothetical protein QFC19_007972 [Naganishia cerealis]|uniref:Uncharacterized protein n=1 Tax=Naganishia cerealis TaxID=610337 RepID=A0ACC2V5U6_9TREE|nr:hypothetical protein QFC19_007972 [Naganishia cerealis]